MTDHLRRNLAPLTDAAWEAVDEEATRILRHFLSVRASIDVEGPEGWDATALPTGGVESLGSVADGVEGGRRQVRPFVELRVPFTVSLTELAQLDRGGRTPDLSSVADAAQKAALAEDRILGEGWAAAGVDGIASSSPHQPVAISEDYAGYAGLVARAVMALRQAGVGGPYAIALGPRCHTGVIETTAHGGYPVLEHLRLILGGPVLWAPAVDGAVVVSRRGGDYRLVLGQDWSIGYRGHDGDTVELYLEESFAFEVLDPAAAVALRYL